MKKELLAALGVFNAAMGLSARAGADRRYSFPTWGDLTVVAVDGLEGRADLHSPIVRSQDGRIFALASVDDDMPRLPAPVSPDTLREKLRSAAWLETLHWPAQRDWVILLVDASTLEVLQELEALASRMTKEGPGLSVGRLSSLGDGTWGVYAPRDEVVTWCSSRVEQICGAAESLLAGRAGTSDPKLEKQLWCALALSFHRLERVRRVCVLLGRYFKRSDSPKLQLLARSELHKWSADEFYSSLEEARPKSGMLLTWT